MKISGPKNQFPRRRFLSNSAILLAASQIPINLPRADTNIRALNARIPSTGEELTRVGLGTYLAFDVDDNAAEKKKVSDVLKAFYDGGGRMVDTSPMYGSAESVLGEVAKTLGLEDKLFMATKVWINGRENGINQIEQSFKKLHSHKIDLLQIHNLLDWKTHIATLNDLKSAGRIKYIGVTHYNSDVPEMEEILHTQPIDFIQIPYSLADTNAERTLIPLAAKKRVAVIAHQPFASGNLFRKVRSKALPKFAQQIGIKSWAQYFLKYILANPDVQFTIPATRSVAHLRDNMEAARGPFPTAKQREQMRDYINEI
jgi:aryl-alcohol dehydrogenase-like predicted oxidoreductase